MKIAVIGMGYVGLVTAISLAEAGNEIIAIEKNAIKLEKLKSGISPIYEPNIQQYLKKHKNNIQYVSNYKRLTQEVKVIFICVGTPENKDGTADTRNVYEAISEIINNNNLAKDIIIVIKSTVPIGTNKNIQKLIKNKTKTNRNIKIVSNPEFLSQGTAIEDAINPQRIVLGTDSKEAIKILKLVYKKNSRKYVITDSNTAELIKYACNSFLALKISYMNELANICELINGNIKDLEKGMRTDKRIGKYFLKSGVGYGGSCFPKDTKALDKFAKSRGYKIKTLEATILVNKNQRIKLIEKAKKYYKSFNNLNVAILGTSFKPNTDDIRESPAIDNINILIKEKSNIKVYDPVSLDKIREKYNDSIEYCNNIDEAITGADLCLIFTEWKEIKEYKLNNFVKYMHKAIVLDGRNCYEINKLPKKMIYEAIGKKVSIHSKYEDKLK